MISIKFKFKADSIEQGQSNGADLNDKCLASGLEEEKSFNLSVSKNEFSIKKPSETVNKIWSLRNLAALASATVTAIQVGYLVGNNFDQSTIRKLDKAAYSSEDKITKKSPLFELKSTKQTLESGNEIADQLVGKISYPNFRRVYVTDVKSGKGVIFLPAKDIIDINHKVLHAGEIKNQDGSIRTFENIQDEFAAPLTLELRKEAKERRAIVDLPMVLNERIQPIKDKYFRDLTNQQKPFTEARNTMLKKVADKTAIALGGKYEIIATSVTNNQTIDRYFTSDIDLANLDRNVIGGNEVIRFEFRLNK